MAQSLTREEIEKLPYLMEVKSGTFKAGNPAKLVEGLIGKVNNGLGSTDYFAPAGKDKFVFAHRN